MTEEQRQQAIDALADHMSLNDKDGTYWHILTRVKSARFVGTLTIDDFEEIGLDHVVEIVDVIDAILNPAPSLDDEMIAAANAFTAAMSANPDADDAKQSYLESGGNITDDDYHYQFHGVQK